jgi:hypothetical protein
MVCHALPLQKLLSRYLRIVILSAATDLFTQQDLASDLLQVVAPMHHPLIVIIAG